MTTQKLRVIDKTPNEIPGHVLFQEKSVPLRGNDPSAKFSCGSCGELLMIGINPDSLTLIFRDFSKYIIRCNKCNAYNDATPPPPGPFELDTDLIDHIKRLLEHAVESRNKLFSQFEEMGLEDPRISICDHLHAVVSVTFLNLIHIKTNLRFSEWWEKQGLQKAVTSGMVPGMLSNYMAMTNSSLMFFSFSLFENGIRRIIRMIDPEACSGGSAEFKSVYEWLFARLRKDGWKYSAGDPSSFLDLYRIFRNTLHNNGIYYPSNGKNQELKWRGKIYKFEISKKPEFYGWEFYIMLLQDLISLNHEIMTSKIVTKLYIIL